MKDASGPKRSRPNSDLEENDSKRGSEPKEKADKQKRKKLRKRRSSSSPEEDIIDGFVIASYSSLRNLEVSEFNVSFTDGFILNICMMLKLLCKQCSHFELSTNNLW